MPRKQLTHEPTLKQKTAKGLFWGGLSNGIQQVIGAVFGIVIARILSPDDYGLVGMLAIFTAIANTILESGFTAALVNKKEIRHEDYNAVFWFNLIAGIAMYILLFFAAPLIARFYGKPELTNLSRLLFFSFLIGSTGVAHFAVMYKKMMVKERAMIDIITVFFSGAVGLTLALNGFAYWGLAIQTVLYTSIAVLFRWYYSPWRPTFTINFKPLKTMFGFSSKLFITNIFTQISNNIFSVLLGKLYGERQVGYYSQGSKWMSMGNAVISGMIFSVAQPVFVEANEDKSRQLNIFRKMIRFGAFVSFPAMFGLAFIGNEFILITVGEKWLESVPFLQLFSVWAAFAYLSGLYSQLLLSYGKSDLIMIYSIALSLLILATALIMSEWGILPMVRAYVTVSFLSIGGWHYFVQKLTGLRSQSVLKDIAPYLGITLATFALTWLITKGIENLYLLLFSKIIIASALYIVAMRLTNSTLFNESLAYIKSNKA
ncbi:Lipopolysaccharide biosynthesis protein wzxC [Bacteroidales bacterium Barb6XT]|nr:Lipopolysaccharide biosynthesis protein wzxC [Bacteroidales bacterium Barb6XT]